MLAACLAVHDLLPRSQATYQATYDRLLGAVDDAPIEAVSGDDLAGVLSCDWGQAQPTTYNRRRAALS